MLSIRSSLTAAALLLCGGSASPQIAKPSGASSSGWSQYGANMAGTFMATGGGAIGKVKWVTGTPSGVSGPVAFAPDGSLVYTSLGGSVVEESPTGAPKWSYDTHTGSGGGAAAVGPEGDVYASFGTSLYALGSTGQRLWSSAPVTSISSPSVAEDGTVYVLALIGSYYLEAFRPNGTRKWSFPMGGGVSNPTAPLVGGDGTIYVAKSASTIVAVRSNGTPKWTVSVGDGVTSKIGSGLAISPDNSVYVSVQGRGGNPSQGVVVSIGSNGTVTWTSLCPAGVQPTGTPAVDDQGNVFFQGQGGLTKFDSRGQLEWWNPSTGLSPAPVAGPPGTIYSLGLEVQSLNEEGDAQWSVSTAQVGFGSVDTKGDLYYVSKFDFTLHSISVQGARLLAQGSPDLFYEPSIGPDGTLYSFSAHGYLYAFDPNGRLKWRYYLSGTSTFCPPVVGADGTVYVETQTDLYAVSSDGLLKWTLPVANDYSLYVPPSMGADGSIYCITNSGFEAVDSNGNVKWTFAGENNALYAPLVGSDGTIYTFDSESLYAIDPTNGSVIWSENCVGFFGLVLIPHGLILCGLGATELSSSGSVVWSSGIPFAEFCAVLPNGNSFFANNLQGITAVSSSGSTVWQLSVETVGSLALGNDGTIYLCSAPGTFYVLNPTTGKTIWSLNGIYGADPVIGADGTIYVAVGSRITAIR